MVTTHYIFEVIKLKLENLVDFQNHHDYKAYIYMNSTYVF